MREDQGADQFARRVKASRLRGLPVIRPCRFHGFRTYQVRQAEIIRRMLRRDGAAMREVEQQADKTRQQVFPGYHRHRAEFEIHH